jgi:hypothetical protein
MATVSWRDRAWKVIASKLTTRGLAHLRSAMARDDAEIVQGVTYDCLRGHLIIPEKAREVTCCCPLGYALRHGKDRSGDKLSGLGVLRKEFERLELDCQAELKDHKKDYERFLDWIDEGPRAHIFLELTNLVTREIDKRHKESRGLPEAASA